MKKDESLIEVKENKFTKILNSVKNFFYKITNKNEAEKTNEIKQEEVKTQNSPLNDVEILGKVIRGEIQSKDVDDETKERLIVLCQKRGKEIDEKIRITNEKIAKIDNLLLKIEEIKNS